MKYYMKIKMFLWENVKDLYSRCIGSRENTKNKVQIVLQDAL